MRWVHLNRSMKDEIQEQEEINVEGGEGICEVGKNMEKVINGI